jgi:hypothetical protein
MDEAGTKVDLDQLFSKISRVEILAKAKSIWDHPQIVTNRRIHGTEAYNARLFRVFRTDMLTNEFLTVL